MLSFLFLYLADNLQKTTQTCTLFPMSKLYTNIKIEELENSEVEIKGEIPVSAVEERRDDIVKELLKTAEFDGFRKGHVTEAILVKNTGEPAILHEVAEKILQESYAEIVLENKLDAVGRPFVSITKLAPGNPIEFTIKTALVPKITLPDYKKIASGIVKKNKGETFEVTEEEVEEVYKNIKENKAKIEKIEGDLPELTDEDVKKLGDFKDLKDFDVKLRENMLKEKKMKHKEQTRIAISDAIILKSDIPLPQIFVESELDKIIGELKSRIQQMGLSFEDYLTHAKKTEEDLRNDSRDEAAKRAKLQLVLNEITVKEELKPDEEKAKKEVDHILSHYKDAKRENVEAYVHSMMTNEAVFNLLETE